jgi:hypothetical protein
MTAEPNDGMFEPSAWEWARAQWSGAALGDVRRTRRAVAVGAAMAEASASGLPQQMGSWAATKAAYRLMDCEDVTHEGVSAPHWRASREAAAAHDGPVFFVQDGTCVDLTRHAPLEDAGRIGDSPGPWILRAFLPCGGVGHRGGARLGAPSRLDPARAAPQRSGDPGRARPTTDGSRRLGRVPRGHWPRARGGRVGERRRPGRRRFYPFDAGSGLGVALLGARLPGPGARGRRSVAQSVAGRTSSDHAHREPARPGRPPAGAHLPGGVAGGEPPGGQARSTAPNPWTPGRCAPGTTTANGCS